MSRNIASGDTAGFKETLTGAMELVLCLTLPAAVGLATLGEPIMRLIYEHGRFGPADTHASAAALAAYAFGLPGYSAMKVVQPAYVAMGDAKTPMFTALVAVALNIGLNYLFVRVLQVGHVGLALSTSLMATGNVLALIVLLEWRNPSLKRRRLAGQMLRIALACAAMGVVAVSGYSALQRRGLATGSRGALAELAVLLPLCGAVYLLVAHLCGVRALATLAPVVRRRLGRGGRRDS
jgi:putative peptidoglycan lipid II flippase